MFGWASIVHSSSTSVLSGAPSSWFGTMTVGGTGKEGTFLNKVENCEEGNMSSISLEAQYTF